MESLGLDHDCDKWNECKEHEESTGDGSSDSSGVNYSDMGCRSTQVQFPLVETSPCPSPPPEPPHAPAFGLPRGGPQFLPDLLQHLAQAILTTTIITAAPVGRVWSIEKQQTVACAGQDLGTPRILCKLPPGRAKHDTLTHGFPVSTDAVGKARLLQQSPKSMCIRHCADFFVEMGARVLLHTYIMLQRRPCHATCVMEAGWIVWPQFAEVMRIIIEQDDTRLWCQRPVRNGVQNNLIFHMRGACSTGFPFVLAPTQLVEVPFMLPRTDVMLKAKFICHLAILRCQHPFLQNPAQYRCILVTPAPGQQSLEPDVRQQHDHNPSELQVRVQELPQVCVVPNEQLTRRLCDQLSDVLAEGRLPALVRPAHEEAHLPQPAAPMAAI
mmetsp:Transcript_102461/g.285537  ORF Transcript_102461/g.285537 Transcript_102461/m.285537 type:complete len:383 (-) Transcript_102461:101-1249(-)